MTDDFSRIRSWIKARLKAWEASLESRSDADKRSAQGRLKTKTYKQTKEYIRTLDTALQAQRAWNHQSKGAARDDRALRRRRVRESERRLYLVAIGNRAWPIGVTSVGIHTKPPEKRWSRRTWPTS